MRSSRLAVSLLAALLLLAAAIFFLFPVLLALMNSLKTEGEMFKSVVQWPKTLHWEN